jgi:hypothetical protein
MRRRHLIAAHPRQIDLEAELLEEKLRHSFTVRL